MYFTPAPKPVRDENNYKEKAIVTASKIVCLAGRCAMCSAPGEYGKTLFSHHIVHRKYGNTAAMLENMLPVCVKCHSLIHRQESWFRNIWLENRSPGLFDRLWALGRELCGLDFAEVYEKLLERYHNALLERAQ